MKKIRIILSMSLALLMMTFAFVIGTSAADVWDGTTTSGWYDESADTLVIDSAADLAAFVSSVNGGNVFSGKTVRLDCDIIWTQGDYSEWSELTAPARSWTPIGTSEYPFSGTFDGNGHTVSGLYYYGNATGVGFFGYVKGAVITDLHINNTYFHAKTRIGTIVGSSQSGDLTISGCSAKSYLLSNYTELTDHHVGGIGGYLDGGSTYSVTVTGCAFDGNITSDDGLNIGGIVGTIKGKTEAVSGCLAVGTYTARNRVGGIIGRSYLDITVSDCYADVDLITWGTANQGGIIGGLRRTPDIETTPQLAVYRCYYNGSNLHSSSDSLGKFTSLPTRLGSAEYDSTTTYGSVAADSTYYTDSANDNSYTAQSGQQALPESVTKLGGLDEFLSQSTYFKKNIYGNVELTTLTCTHDCEENAEKWLDDTETGGQYAECMAPGCDKVLKRDQYISLVGTSVRYEDPSGIRFLTKVNKNDFFKELYTGDDDHYRYEGANVTFGTVIIPSDMLEGPLTVDTKSALNVEAKKIYTAEGYEQDSEKFYYTAVVVNYPELINTYNRELSVRSYMKYTEGGETVYVYSDMGQISFYDISNTVYSTTEDASIKEGLNMILALGAVDEDFYADDPNRVMLLENASPELFADYAASLEAQGFTKHSNYEYSDNHFGMYYNDDYVISFYYTPKSIGKYTEKDQEWYVGGSAITDDMDVIAESVQVEDIENVMRIIVEKRSTVDIPTTYSDNTYKDKGVKNSIAYAFPNDNYKYYGMGYIIQLVDGSFIIIDGGRNRDDPRDDSTKTDADYIYEYLTAMKPEGTEKPVIAAWILTHVHSDHTDAMKAFVAAHGADVELEQVIYNFMSGDTAVPTGNRDQERYAVDYIKKYFPNVKIHKAHTGYKFFVRNAEIRILYSIDDLIPESFEGMFANNESIAFDIIIDGTQRLMFTGEIFIPGSRALVNMYGADLKSDVVQISHHGNYGATLEVNSLIWPDDGTDYKNDDLKFALLPNGNNRQARNRLALKENAPFVNLLGETITGKLNKIYISADIIFENGTVTSGYNTELGDSVIASSGAIGSWKTIPLYTGNHVDIIIPWPDEWN